MTWGKSKKSDCRCECVDDRAVFFTHGNLPFLYSISASLLLDIILSRRYVVATKHTPYDYISMYHYWNGGPSVLESMHISDCVYHFNSLGF